MIPIIVPTRTERDCIIVKDTKYCEKKELTGKELGYAFATIAVLILSIVIWFNISMRFADYVTLKLNIDNVSVFIITFAIVPILAIGLLSILTN